MHKPLRLDSISDICGGHLIGDGEVTITGVAIDSRKVAPGDLFVCIPGKRHDGHDYIEQARDRGAAAALVSRKLTTDLPVIVTENTVIGLGLLGGVIRDQFSPIAIGVTGSVGKTTTKDMIALVCGEQYVALATKGNYNTEIGVPITLVEIGPEHEVLIVEMGMRGSGQIKYLADLVRPDIGVITNVGTAHIELTGGIDQTARCKRELLTSLGDDGTAVINADDTWCEWMTDGLCARVVRFSVRNGSEVRARDVQSSRDSVSFTLITGDEEARVEMGVPGRHLVPNALAAACVGYVLGIGAKQIATALAKFQPGPMRSQVCDYDGISVIDDTYNASPESVAAALGLLADIASSRKICVLGPMLELGEQSKQIHLRLGEQVASARPDLLITVGELGKYIAEGARSSGLNGDRIVSVDNNEQAWGRLSSIVCQGDTVLIKGSRGAALEEVCAQLARRGE